MTFIGFCNKIKNHIPHNIRATSIKSPAILQIALPSEKWSLLLQHRAVQHCTITTSAPIPSLKYIYCICTQSTTDNKYPNISGKYITALALSFSRISTVAALLQQYYCGSSTGAALLQQHYCSSTTGAVLLQQHYFSCAVLNSHNNALSLGR